MQRIVRLSPSRSLAALASLVLVVGACGGVPATPRDPGATWAVSLAVLQERLAECEGDFSGCPEPLATLGGLTRLEGYVVGDEGNDVILFGRRTPGAPPLFTEDFAVALRNAWHQYAERQGTTIYHSAPGCSIDPEPSTLAGLERIASRIPEASGSEAVEALLERWQSRCSEPQSVRILGVPPSRFAHVMVEADYLMKRIVDGSLKAGPEGFEGLPARIVAEALEAAGGGSEPSLRISTWNRFELFPGETVYGVDQGIVELVRTSVRLLTEAEYLSRTGNLTGSGEADPLARALAEEFSERYGEIAAEHPIYQELEDLFRFVAVAHSLRENIARERLAGLLDGPAISAVPVERYKPGISNVARVQESLEMPGSSRMLWLWVPSCGGVRIDPERAGTVKVSRNLAGFRSALMNARLSPSQLVWQL